MTDTAVKQEKKVYDENYWMTVLIYFASFLIGLGIVAEIAFNWELIPDNVKLGGALVAMIANALALIWAMKKEKNILKQVLACVYAFLIMGVIGLIGQVFQLKSDLSFLYQTTKFRNFNPKSQCRKCKTGIFVRARI